MMLLHCNAQDEASYNISWRWDKAALQDGMDAFAALAKLVRVQTCYVAVLDRAASPPPATSSPGAGTGGGASVGGSGAGASAAEPEPALLVNKIWGMRSPEPGGYGDRPQPAIPRVGSV